MGDVRGRERVDRHVATLGDHAGSGGVDEVGVAGPADGEERRVHVDRPGLVADSVQDAHTGFERLELVDCGAGDDLDAAPPESVFERDRDVDVGSLHDPGRVLDKRDVATEVRQDRRELTAGVGRPDDADPVGQRGQAAHVLVGQAELGPGDRQSPRPAADGDDHPIRSPRPAVGRGDRVGVDEPGVAGLLDEVDPDGADVVGDALALIEVAGHPLGVGQGGGDVDLGPWPAQAERFPRAPVPAPGARPEPACAPARGRC